MELDKNEFSSAAAGTLGIVYIICTIFVWLWPVVALKLFGWLVHLVNVDKFAGDVAVTAGGLLIGLLQIVVYTYVVAWVFAWLHNRFMRPAAK